MEDKYLFDAFQPVSEKEWKQKIQFDLKGGDYNTLLTNTNEGITIKPFYHQNSFETLEVPKPKHDSKICQSIFVASEKIANSIAIEAISKGANAIIFIAEKPFNYQKLFTGIPLNKPFIIIEIKFLDSSFLNKFIPFAKDNKIELFLPILSNLVLKGNWFNNRKEDFKQLKTLLTKSENKINLIGIDSTIYQNAGANNVQQIAYGLSEYLSYLDNNVLSEKLFIKVAIGSNYFFEIAKLRALRYLFHLLKNEMKLKTDLKLIAIPSKRNKTLYDYNVNMLRTTTEKMSAMLGGAEFVCSFPYDAIYHKSNEFGERIARNQLLILKEESYFKDAYKIVNGSYYIEKITLQLAEKALELVKDIDKKGGFLSQLKKGTIQRKIKEAAQKEQEQFDKGELVLLGTNKYPNEKDKMKDNLELFPFVKKNPRKTIIQPIIEKRLAEELEKKRLDKEK